jgi:hypothetical protein
VPLPPLPPVGGEPPGRSVTDLLAAEHRELAELSGRLAAEPGDARLAGVVIATLARHLSAEEQYLHPALRAAVPGGAGLAAGERARDRLLLELLRRLGRGERVADQVAEGVRRHVSTDALRLLAAVVAEEDLIRLGNRVEMAEEAAPTRPHPGTPATPPWNKIIDPAVGVVDKLRDVISRRTTYLSDL